MSNTARRRKRDLPRSPELHIAEEVVNSLIHGAGIFLSLVGGIALIVHAFRAGNPWLEVSSIVYGLALIFLYTASTLYHSFQSPGLKHLFKVLDHSAIYIMIAATYTPFTLLNLRGVWGWTLFGVSWGLALTGILYKSFFVYKFRGLSTFLYLGMGWLVVVAMGPLVENMAPGGVLLLVLGGVSYTLGVLFYIRRQLPFSHAIWHLFVLMGSVFHYFAIYFYAMAPAVG